MIILIESRRFWRRTAQLALLLGAGLFGWTGAHAQPVAKIAADLRSAIDAPKTPKLNWAKDVAAQRYVKVLVVSNSADPDPVDLRASVLAAGGSVYYRYLSVPALSVLMPAAGLELATTTSLVRAAAGGPGLDGTGVVTAT